jgi:ABC-type transporter Mla subunit MlaD
MDIMNSFIAVLASMTSYILVDYVWKYFSRFIRKPQSITSYGDKLNQLTSSLVKASKEVDRVLTELSEVTTNRENTIKNLEANLGSLEKTEIDLKQRIEALEKLPIPVAEYFAKLVASGEKRSARRDYLLFGAGVAVSTVIAIILKVAGIG